VDSPVRMAEAMRDLKVGATIRLTVFREGQSREVKCVLPERPLLPGDIPDQRPSLVPQSTSTRFDSARYRL